MYKSKRWCLYHEETCSQNLNNRDICYSCTHFSKKKIYYEFFDCENFREISFCSIKNVFLLNKKAQTRNYLKKYKFQYEDYNTQNMIKNENDCKFYFDKDKYFTEDNILANPSSDFLFDKKTKEFIIVKRKIKNNEIILI